MHELERHNLILLSVQQRPVLTVPELCELTGASEATIRRDIISLDQEKKLTNHVLYVPFVDVCLTIYNK